jgi:AcrR family transcriptional regulator
MRYDMPTPLKKEGSRERILEGAAEEFAQSGFAGARIDRIARRTKLNVRMIYYHFGSKKGLYRAVLENIYEEASKIIDATEREQDPTVAALGLYFDLLAENPRFADVLVRELLDGSKHLKALFQARPELYDKVHLSARKLLEDGVKAGCLRDQDAPLTVFSLTSILCFLTAVRGSYGLFLDGRQPDKEAWRTHLYGLLFEGLRKR